MHRVSHQKERKIKVRPSDITTEKMDVPGIETKKAAEIMEAEQEGVLLTVEELNEIYYINKEIAGLQRELANLKQKNFYKANIITDMPKGGETKEQNMEYVSAMIEIENRIRNSLKRLQYKREKAISFINTIKDPELRLIIQLRSINNMSWYQIGDEIGIDRRTASKKFYNYFEKCTECDMDM